MQWRPHNNHADPLSNKITNLCPKKSEQHSIIKFKEENPRGVKSLIVKQTHCSEKSK